eukprot:1044901-Prorocentrum_lima.AAC.1
MPRLWRGAGMMMIGVTSLLRQTSSADSLCPRGWQSPAYKKLELRKVQLSEENGQCLLLAQRQDALAPSCGANWPSWRKDRL